MAVRYLSEGTPEPPGRRQGHGESCGGELEAGGMNSRRIAFVSNSQVYVMNADGSGQQNLTRNPAPDRSPVWSPGMKGS